jgi:hypothetical protein
MSHVKLAMAVSVVLIMDFITLAQADDMSMVKSAEPIAAPYAAVVDIIGIQSGMSVDSVRSAMKKEFETDLIENNMALKFRVKSVPIASQKYTESIIGLKPNEKVSVSFGTPSTGNNVVAAKRDIEFPDPLTAPIKKDIESQLDAKYGPATEIDDHGLRVQRYWIFNSKSLTNGSKVMLMNLNLQGTFAPNELGTYQQMLVNGVNVGIKADYEMYQQDPSRVRSLSINFDDQANKALTLTEALKQLEAFGSAAYDKNATPQQAPRL